MKKLIIIYSFLILYILPEAGAQLWKLRRTEVTFAAGTTHFFGDIGGFSNGDNYLGFRDISIYNIGFNASAFVRYRLTETLSLRAGISGGFFRSDDRYGSHKSRRFESSTNFFEPSIIGEFRFIKNRMENRYLFIRGKKMQDYPAIHYLDMYLFAGFGAVSYDVHPNLALAYRIFGTGANTAVVPAGIGITRNLPGVSAAGIELGGRFVLGDRPDGFASPRSYNDIYYFFNLTYTRKIKTRKHIAF